MTISSLQFLGATGTVTGSRFLLDTPGHRVLVDCGLFQGLKAHRLRNWEPFPVDPATIDTVIVTHAHIDHSGYLPALARDGFRGRVVCTAETAELVGILLRDSARLQEEDARYANRVGSSKHRPALPLYTSDDAEKAITLLDPCAGDLELALTPDVSCRLRHSGHILGAASVTVRFPTDGGEHRSVLFSGDLGRPHHPILAPPAEPDAADVIVVESTYGDRDHADPGSEMAGLATAVRKTAARGGTVVIPAFAVDRTEVVLHALRELEDEGLIPQLPIFVDSPMAIAVLDVYRRAVAAGAANIRADVAGSDLFDPARITACRSTADSKRLADLAYPSIIISASGMATGGRVLHHLSRCLPDGRDCVVLTGFQAEGTRGDRLERGERSVKIFGRYVPVRAEIIAMQGFSVHADASELVGWLGATPAPPDVCYVVHGSETASHALAGRVAGALGWNAVVPGHLERVRLD